MAKMYKPSTMFNDGFFSWIEGAGTAKNAIDTLSQYKGTQYESQYATSAVFASYLKRAPSSHFSRKEATNYLAKCEDGDILETYFKPHYFIGMSLEESLRFAFTDLKLKILNDTTKINVLLEYLAKAYLMGNMKKFEEKSRKKLLSAEHIQEYIETYNVMIMLQNSLHSNVKQSKMTKECFMEFLIDTVWDEDEMETVYDNISKVSLYDDLKRSN